MRIKLFKHILLLYISLCVFTTGAAISSSITLIIGLGATIHFTRLTLKQL